MIKFLFFIAPAFLLTACQPSGPRPEATKLSNFKGLPPQASECFCLFSGTEKEFAQEQYFFVSDLDSNATISIAGEPTKLKLIRSTRDPNVLDERGYEEVYSNGLYSVRIKVRFKERSSDEVWLNSGLIELLFKEVIIEQRSFVGECGC